MILLEKDKEKFGLLLNSLKVNFLEFDEFLSATPHILRSVRGHAFEVWFDREMAERGYVLEKIGGDNVVDRKYGGFSLQLKTPYLNGTKENKVVQYKMHKTHGAERKPLCYYKKEEFADFLVGMHPKKGVIICPKDKLLTRGEVSQRLDFKEYVADPLPFEWDTEWLNRYDLLNMNIDDAPVILEHTAEESTLFPKTISKIGFTDYDIVHAILDENNFRIWEQLIKGSIREFHFKKFANKSNIKLLDPSEGENMNGRERQKIDYLLEDGVRIQVKGLTRGMCNENILGCETQCSHGRVPTRLYKTSDFDYLAIVIDPNSLPKKLEETHGIDTAIYNFLIVPMSRLPIHPRSSEWDSPRIKASFLFDPLLETYNNITSLKSVVSD